ncbi:MAG TPA: peptidoglycan bridge formation glycyltransferase FemA/FemB family protein [Chloroflexota bacterium]
MSALPPDLPGLAVEGDYRVAVCDRTHDPDWDAFLARTAGGDHAQSGLMARLKAPLGWRVARVVVSRDGRIVGGAQLLLRSLPLAGAIGYVARGPLCALDDPALARLVVERLQRVARARGLRYLIVQPPLNGQAVARELVGRGFRPTWLEPQPAHAVLIDLSRSLDDLLAAMKGKTRYNLRLGQRKGIRVREGTEADLDTFHRLLVATSQRQGFSVQSRSYFAEMWRIFAPPGNLKLFLAEHEGEAISAALTIPFGDTVTYKRGAWSGRQGNVHANEVTHWAAIGWAKANGYRYYDFEGIDPRLAPGIARGQIEAGSLARSVTSFKLGFGGKVVLSPGNYDYVPNPLLRRAYTTISPRLADWSLMAKVQNAVRGRGRGREG